MSLAYLSLNPGFLTTSLKACACAGVQGSRGAEERLIQVLSPLPLCPSAPLLHQTPEACEKCGYTFTKLRFYLAIQL